MIRSFANYRSTVSRIGWCLCIMIALMNAGEMLMMIIDPIVDLIDNENAVFFIHTFMDTVSYLSYFMIPGILFYRMSGKYDTEPIRFSFRMPWFTPLLIFAGIAVTLTAARCNAWMMSAIGYELPEELFVPSDYSDPSSVALFITVSLAPGFCEEFLFRGVIYGNLRRYGKSQAILLSALLFSMMHQNIAQSFYTFVAGIMLALCYELTGSIWCGTFMHLFNNLYSVLQEILYGRLGSVAYPIITLMDTALYLIGAVSTIVLILVLTKKKRASGANGSPDPSVSGMYGRLEGLIPLAESTADRPTFRKALAPGLIVFSALALASTALTVLISYGYVILYT